MIRDSDDNFNMLTLPSAKTETKSAVHREKDLGSDLRNIKALKDVNEKVQGKSCDIMSFKAKW